MPFSGNANHNDAKKTSTMTFRLEEKVLKILKKESERQQVSLNTYVNQILKRFVDWDMYEPKVGMIPIAKPLVIELFGKLDEDEITTLALEIGKNVVYDTTLFMKNKVDMDSFLSWFETRMTSSLTEINHTVQNNIHNYVLKHDLGKNWSLYHKLVLTRIFNEVFKKNVDIDISNTTLQFRFRE